MIIKLWSAFLYTHPLIVTDLTHRVQSNQLRSQSPDRAFFPITKAIRCGLYPLESPIVPSLIPVFTDLSLSRDWAFTDKIFDTNQPMNINDIKNNRARRMESPKRTVGGPPNKQHTEASDEEEEPEKQEPEPIKELMLEEQEGDLFRFKIDGKTVWLPKGSGRLLLALSLDTGNQAKFDTLVGPKPKADLKEALKSTEPGFHSMVKHLRTQLKKIEDKNLHPHLCRKHITVSRKEGFGLHIQRPGGRIAEDFNKPDNGDDE